MLKDKKIGLIGCGNMGQAMLYGLISSGRANVDNLMCSDISPDKISDISNKYPGIRVTNNNREVIRQSDIIILSVKPQDIEKLLLEVRGELSEDKLLISVAAGITTSFVENILGKKIPVIRCMPNICATVRKSVSAIIAGRHVADEHLLIAKGIFESVGKVIEVKREELMDIVTAVSGAGPAYIFYFVESLIDAAKQLGLDFETAKNLVYQTLSGASEMLANSNNGADVLRLKVTSPKGVTEQAIKYWDESNFKQIVVEALKKAKIRAEELKR